MSFENVNDVDVPVPASFSSPPTVQYNGKFIKGVLSLHALYWSFNSVQHRNIYG